MSAGQSPPAQITAIHRKVRDPVTAMTTELVSGSPDLNQAKIESWESVYVASERGWRELTGLNDYLLVSRGKPRGRAPIGSNASSKVVPPTAQASGFPWNGTLLLSRRNRRVPAKLETLSRNKPKPYRRETAKKGE